MTSGTGGDVAGNPVTWPPSTASGSPPASDASTRRSIWTPVSMPGAATTSCDPASRSTAGAHSVDRERITGDRVGHRPRDPHRHGLAVDRQEVGTALPFELRRRSRARTSPGTPSSAIPTGNNELALA